MTNGWTHRAERWTYDYDAFGKMNTSLSAANLTRYGYTGQQYDAETSLNYFDARYYAADVGRFINQDPIRDGVNWYAYVGNDPVNHTDPTGLAAQAEPTFRQQQLAGLNNAMLDIEQRRAHDISSGGNSAEHFDSRIAILRISFDILDLEERKDYARSQNDTNTGKWLYKKLEEAKGRRQDFLQAGTLSDIAWYRQVALNTSINIGSTIEGAAVETAYKGRDVVYDAAYTANTYLSVYTGYDLQIGQNLGRGVIIWTCRIWLKCLSGKCLKYSLQYLPKNNLH